MEIQDFLQENLRLILSGGKGGVGKTTFAASLALRLAEAGQRTLVVSTDPAHSLGDSLGTPLGPEAKPVGPHLWAMEIDADQALAQFKQQHQQELELLFDTSTYLDSGDVRQMLSLTIPGIDEVMGFKTVADLALGHSYDKIVVDTAPTGHALRLLTLPQVLDEWIKTLAQMRWKYRTVQQTFKGKYSPDDADDLLLDLKKTVKRLQSLLTDPRRCEFVVVAKPEAMVMAETERLVQALQQHGVAMRHLVMNGVMTDQSNAFCRQVRQHQNPYLAQAGQLCAQWKASLALAPLLPQEVRGMESLQAFAAQLFGEGHGR